MHKIVDRLIAAYYAAEEANDCKKAARIYRVLYNYCGIVL